MVWQEGAARSKGGPSWAVWLIPPLLVSIIALSNMLTMRGGNSQATAAAQQPAATLTWRPSCSQFNQASGLCSAASGTDLCVSAD